jgi:hypothetical protein
LDRNGHETNDRNETEEDDSEEDHHQDGKGINNPIRIQRPSRYR